MCLFYSKITVWSTFNLKTPCNEFDIYVIAFANAYTSVTSSLELSLAEVRDESTWPQLQFGVYKKILDLSFFLVLKFESSAILIFKVISLNDIKKGCPVFIIDVLS